MSNAKFTPGPWSIKNGVDIFGPLGGDSGDGVECDPNDGWHVAEVDEYPSFVLNEMVVLGADVRNANAHLIAAAPDLYEALEIMLADYWEASEDFDNESQMYAETVISQSHAALAKARGES